MTIERLTIWTKNIEKIKPFYLELFKVNANEKYFNPMKKSFLIFFRFQAELELN